METPDRFQFTYSLIGVGFGIIVTTLFFITTIHPTPQQTITQIVNQTSNLTTTVSTNSTLAIDIVGLPCSQLQYLVNKLLIPFYYYGFSSGNPTWSMELAQIYMHMMDEKGCPYT